MNYIKQLQKQVQEQSDEIARLRAGITDLNVYVNSGKFFCGDALDGKVNVSDVSLRLREILNA